MTGTAYLMTRGRPRENRYDYQFIGPVPPARWWDRVTPHVQTTQREVVVARHDDGVGVFVCGVPSARSDIGGTPIRYTLVIDDVRADPELLRRIAALAWAADGYERLGARLDKEFEPDWIDAVIGGEVPAEDVPDRTAEILDAVLDQPTEDGADRPGSWVGGVGDGEARGAFLARMARLAAEEEDGWAFTSQAFGTARGAQEAADDLRAPVAILLLDSDGVDEIQLLESQSSGKAPALATVSTSGRRLRTSLIVGLAISGMALIAAILWWIVRRFG